MRTVSFLTLITQVLLINATLSSDPLDDELTEEYKRSIMIGTAGKNKVSTVCPLELGIVLDSSRSIYGKDFETCKKFLRDYLQQLDIGSGPNSVRVSLITYGEVIYPEDSFNLNTYSRKSDVIDAIGRVPHRLGESTFTHLGIEHMDQVQMADNVVRPGVLKVALIITDGQSTDPQKTLAAAEAARAHGIVTFALGVGNNVSETELRGIAGDPKRKFQVGNFDELKSITELLAKKTCVKKENPTRKPINKNKESPTRKPIIKIKESPTIRPKNEPCGALNPSDIYFVFSQASLGREATVWTTSFIRQTIESNVMKTGFRFGVISGPCQEDAGFDLDDYDNFDDINLRLKSYEERKMSSLLQRLSEDGYTMASGARTGVKKVAVLFTQTEKDIRQEYIQNLVHQSVTVYLADPSNSGLDFPGTIRLSGSSFGEQVNSFIDKLCRSCPC